MISHSVQAAKAEMEVRSRTILYSDCGKDTKKFDEIVAAALSEIGQPNIMETHPVNPGEGDFGILIVYERP